MNIFMAVGDKSTSPKCVIYCLFVICSARNVLAAERLPNIILVIADDLGFNDVSFHGSPQIPTPNIDALAYTGIILNGYYVSPICTPSRSALFTGKHPIHTGMQHDVIFGTTPYGLPLSEKLLPEYLADLNYSRHLVGKWHLGHFKKEYTPTYRGFESHFGHWTGHKDYYDNMAEESRPEAWGYDHRRNLEVSYDHWGEYATDVYTKESIEIIKAHHQLNLTSKPLFLTISHTAVHSANPYKLLQAPAEEVAKFAHIRDNDRRTYAAMTSKLDESVGQIITTLAETNMLNNSIIIFTTDNGGPAAGFNGNAASNWPLRGVKNTLYDGGVRGAALIWSPLLSASRGRVLSNLMHIQDWVPTLLCGALQHCELLEGLNGTGHMGVNMWDVLKDPGSTTGRTKLLHNIDQQFGNEAIRVGKWKLMHGTTYKGKWDYWYGPTGLEPNGTTQTLKHQQGPIESKSQLKNNVEVHYNSVLSSPTAAALAALNIEVPSAKTIADIHSRSAVRCGPLPKNPRKCTLISGEYCLFDMDSDPCEYNNMASRHPEIVNELRSLLDEYRKSATPPGNKPKCNEGLPKYWNYTWTNWADYV